MTVPSITDKRKILYRIVAVFVHPFLLGDDAGDGLGQSDINNDGYYPQIPLFLEWLTARWIESAGFIKVSICTRHIQIIRTTGGRFVKSTVLPREVRARVSVAMAFIMWYLALAAFPTFWDLIDTQYSVLSAQH